MEVPNWQTPREALIKGVIYRHAQTNLLQYREVVERFRIVQRILRQGSLKVPLLPLNRVHG